MGDAAETGRMTDCLLISFSDLKGHTQQCGLAPRQKSKQTLPVPVVSPLNYPAYSLPNRPQNFAKCTVEISQFFLSFSK